MQGAAAHKSSGDRWGPEPPGAQSRPHSVPLPREGDFPVPGAEESRPKGRATLGAEAGREGARAGRSEQCHLEGICFHLSFSFRDAQDSELLVTDRHWKARWDTDEPGHAVDPGLFAERLCKFHSLRQLMEDTWDTWDTALKTATEFLSVALFLVCTEFTLQ